MGTLYYGEARTPISIEDRALAHVKIVLLAKLRRGESFSLSWSQGADHGGGRNTVWLNPAIALHFEFTGGREPSINREWLEVLNHSAGSTIGMSLLPEPPNERHELVDSAAGRLPE